MAWWSCRSGSIRGGPSTSTTSCVWSAERLPPAHEHAPPLPRPHHGLVQDALWVQPPPAPDVPGPAAHVHGTRDPDEPRVPGPMPPHPEQSRAPQAGRPSTDRARRGAGAPRCSVAQTGGAPSGRGEASSPRPHARREAGPAALPQARDPHLEGYRSPGHPQVVDSASMSATAPGSPQPGAHASRGESTARADRSQPLAEYQLRVNGCARTCAVEPETSLLRVLRERPWLDGHRVRVRHRPMRSSARSCSTTWRFAPVSRRSGARPATSPRSKAWTTATPRRRPGQPGPPSRYRSAATAGPGRSWPRSRCSATGRIPTTRTSHSPWPADSAVTTRIRGSGKAIKRAAAARKAAMSPCGPARPGQPDPAVVMSAAGRPGRRRLPARLVVRRAGLADAQPLADFLHLVQSNSPDLFHSSTWTLPRRSAQFPMSRKKRIASCPP